MMGYIGQITDAIYKENIVFTMGSILEDKKLRTWNRIRISPLSSRAVLAGNFIPRWLG